MRNRSETTEFSGLSIGNERPPAIAEAKRAAEKEEWAWMVDEDPAFYLSKSGRIENTGG